MAKGELEEQARLYQRDEVLGTSVPRALVTYRSLVEKHPRGAAAETALWRLGLLYERIKRFDLAAQAFADLGERYDNTQYDAWFQAGELYRERLNRKDLARAAYARVPPASGRFGEARERLIALEGR
jgi:tetratricopeptide (TPR) repeat protein